MAKRVRITGVPSDQAKVGQTLKHLRNHTGYQCSDCTLKGTCDSNPPPGGPWEVMEVEEDRAADCLVHPTIRMIPTRVRRVKAERAAPVPLMAPVEQRHILLDSNALIEGAKGTFPGMILLILEPPPGFHYHTTQAVADECKFLPGVDREVVFSHITVHPTPPGIDDAITETRGKGITPPSETDAGLFQLAKQDARFTVLVSHDRFHRWTGLPQSLGIADRFAVKSVPDFVKYATRHR